MKLSEKSSLCLCCGNWSGGGGRWWFQQRDIYGKYCSFYISADKIIQHCKATALQLKKKKKRKERNTSGTLPQNDRTRIQYTVSQHSTLSVREPWSKTFLMREQQNKIVYQLGFGRLQTLEDDVWNSASDLCGINHHPKISCGWAWVEGRQQQARWDAILREVGLFYKQSQKHLTSYRFIRIQGFTECLPVVNLTLNHL